MINKSDYEQAIICRDYLFKLQEKVGAKLQRAQEKHDIEGVMNSRTISKLEDEMSIISALIEPHQRIVWQYEEQNRKSDFTDEELKAQWERDNGPLPDRGDEERWENEVIRDGEDFLKECE